MSKPHPAVTETHVARSQDTWVDKRDVLSSNNSVESLHTQFFDPPARARHPRANAYLGVSNISVLEQIRGV